MKDKPAIYSANLFRPKKGYMADEVRFILLVLSGWVAVTFGFQFLLSLMSDAGGRSFFTTTIFFNLPLHYWFTGQFLPLWFVILCVFFNIYIDRLTESHSRRRDNAHE